MRGGGAVLAVFPRRGEGWVPSVFVWLVCLVVGGLLGLSGRWVAGCCKRCGFPGRGLVLSSGSGCAALAGHSLSLEPGGALP